jgi:hypothetical protein
MSWFKGNRLYFLILTLLFGTVVFFEAYAPQPLDWGLYFSKNAETPYGEYLLYDNLDVLFPSQQVTPVRSRIRHVVNNADPSINNYIFINEFFEPDSLDAVYLINFAERGGKVFIAANTYTGYFAEYFRLETENFDKDGDYEFEEDFEAIDWETIGTNQSAELNFEDESLRADSSYSYKYNLSNYYFKQYSAGTSILGRDEFDNPTYIYKAAGQGGFYLHSLPRAFTNYFIADESNHEYVFKALSYLPVTGVYWDEYYKDDRDPSASPLRFIMDQEALRWGFITLMSAILIFMIFSAKRRQRIIPVIPPLKNTTVEFVGIISRLYYQRFNHGNIAQKKIMFFMEHIRVNYQVRTHVINEEFVKTISTRSGISILKIGELFRYIENVRMKGEVTQTDLINLNTTIEEFMRESKRS